MPFPFLIEHGPLVTGQGESRAAETALTVTGGDDEAALAGAKISVGAARHAALPAADEAGPGDGRNPLVGFSFIQHRMILLRSEFQQGTGVGTRNN